jgi:hypothetical protein
VRDYLVENFGFDDSQLKTLGLGKQAEPGPAADGGSIQILVFPPGIEVPNEKAMPTGISSTVPAEQPDKITDVATHLPKRVTQQ